MFSASLSPANAATALAALNIIESEPERVERVNKISAGVREELKTLGYNTGNSQTPIIPIVIGDQFKAMQAWDTLFKAGIYTNVALPPAVPSQTSLLRRSYMATHTDAQVERVLAAFRQLKNKLHI
jgi:8-amino-7-oxononanoate synthase